MGCQPLTVGGLRPKSCWGWLGVLLGVFGVKTPDGWGFDPKRVWGTPNGWGLEVSTRSHHNRPQSAPTIKPGALCVGYGCSARVHGLGLIGIGTTLHRYRLIKHTSFTAIDAGQPEDSWTFPEDLPGGPRASAADSAASTTTSTTKGVDVVHGWGRIAHSISIVSRSLTAIFWTSHKLFD